jgi:hypothetical protein
MCEKRSSITWVNIEKELLPLVEPDAGQPRVVVVDNVCRAARERVGSRLAEDVTHVGAGRDQENAAARPHL